MFVVSRCIYPCVCVCVCVCRWVSGSQVYITGKRENKKRRNDRSQTGQADQVLQRGALSAESHTLSRLNWLFSVSLGRKKK